MRHYTFTHYRRSPQVLLLVGLFSLWLCGWALPLTVPGNKTMLHTVMELIPIVVNASFVFITWHATGCCVNRAILTLSLSLLSFTMFTTAHMLTYPGMPDLFGNGTDTGLSAFYLLLSRLGLALGLLWVICSSAETNISAISALLSHLCVALLTAGIIIFTAAMPEITGIVKDCVIMMGFMKLNLPRAILLLYFLAAAILYLRRTAPILAEYLKPAVMAQILVELSLYLYQPTHDLLIMLSHIYQVLSGLFLVNGLFCSAIREPYQHLIQVKEEIELLAASNAAMYEKARQQQALLEDTFARLGSIVSSRLDLEETMANIADMSTGMVGARQGIVALVHQDPATLQVAAVAGISAPPDFIPITGSLAGQVLATKRAQYVDDVTIYPQLYRPKLVFSTIVSMLAAPIINDNRCIGVLEVYSPAAGTFDAHDALLLTAIGRHAGAAIAGAMLYEETKLRLEEEQYLLQISQAAAKSIDSNTILAECTDLMGQALGTDMTIGFRLHDNTLLPATGSSLDTPPPCLKLEEHPYLAAVLSKKKPADLAPATFMPVASLCGMEKLRQFKAVPLVVDQRTLGVIILGWQKYFNGELVKRDSFIMLMAQQVGLGLEKADLYAQIRSMALSDGLTGLANRRNFDMFLRAELRRAASLKRPLSLIMFDLDKFKLYNDTYGHPTGDKLLSQIGALLQTHVRPIDLPARYGGEEFSIILPECTQAEAVTTAEKIRHAVETSRFPDNQGTLSARITASLGIATYDPQLTPEPPEITQLIEMADQALYRAKQAGRNRVVAYTAI